MTRAPARLGTGAALAVMVAGTAVLLLAALVVGADPTVVPSPSAAPDLLLESGDLRSEGEGPGLVGNPLLILGGVVLLGAVTALATAVLVRVTRRD